VESRKRYNYKPRLEIDRISHRSRFSLYKKIISIILLLIFTWQQITWAQGGVTTLTRNVGKIGTVPKTSLTSKGDCPYFSIPRDRAITRESFQAPSRDELIINIQDAHDSLSAQYSIVDILDTLVKEYNLSLVALEGSSGYIDTSLLKTFPIEEIRKDTADELMKKGELSAGEFFSIVGDNDIELYGIEDNSLYKEHVELFKQTIAKREDNLKTINSLADALTDIKDAIYPERVKELNEKSALYKEGKITFKDYWDYIIKVEGGRPKVEGKEKNTFPLSGKIGTPYFSYPNLEKLARSVEIEKTIDFKKANKEREELINSLKKTLPKEELEPLLVKSLQYKLDKITASEFHGYLLGKMRGDSPRFSNLSSYAEYTRLYESIDIVAVFTEMEAFEDEIKASLFTTDDQRTLNTLIKEAQILKDLFSVTLTNGRLEYLLENIDGFNAQKYIDFIERFEIASSPTPGRGAPRNDRVPTGVTDARGDSPHFSKNTFHLPPSAFDLYDLFSSLDEAVGFYRLALERDRAIVNNTLKRMREDGKKVAALVTGGFHTKGMTDILKSDKTSYVVLVPKFDKDAEKRPYVAILTKRTAPYKELLDTGGYQLATSSHFAGGYFGMNEITEWVRELVLDAMVRAEEQGHDVWKVRDNWLEGYNKAQRNSKVRPVVTYGELETLLDGIILEIAGEELANKTGRYFERQDSLRALQEELIKKRSENRRLARLAAAEFPAKKSPRPSVTRVSRRLNFPQKSPPVLP